LTKTTTKKYLSNSLAKDLSFFDNLEKNYIERANIRARLQFGIVISLEEKPSERVKKKQRMIPEANI